MLTRHFVTCRCDADPSALANYVVALVKKDKPEKELKALCADQLDVFLQKVGFKIQSCSNPLIISLNPLFKMGPDNDDFKVFPLTRQSHRNRDDRRRDERKRRDFDRYGKSSSDSHRERERHERRRGSPRGRSYSRSRSRSGSRGKSRDKEHRGEKGFCVRGDLCPFDHGNDPLIVDDVNLPNMIPFPPPPVMPPAGLPMPPITEPPPSLRIPPMPPYGQPAPPGVFPISNNYDPEGYNPESPALTTAGRNQYRQFIPRVQTQRSNLIGLTSNEGQGSRGTANIVIQTEPVTAASTPGSNVSRFNSEQDSRKRIMGHSTAEGPVPKKPWIEKTNFNNQHKGIFPKRNHYMNTKLEVRKIPRELNNITKLNEHFSKFGTIVNIQVVFGGDPEAALIQYTKNEEARRAISSIEAVLNNRFIRVYWHRECGVNATGLQQQEQSSGSLAAGLAPSQGLQHSNVHKVSKKNQTPYTSTALKSSSKSLGKTGKALEAQEVHKKKQEALKLQQDMRKKKQEMLQTQIECQKTLINRLEKNRGMKPEDRAKIMKTLKDLTDKITQLQNEMNPASQVSSTKSNHSQTKTKTDAQKELLDAELDFHQKMSSGEDTTDLKRKLGQLQVEATRLGLIRPPAGRGRGRGKMALEPGSMHVGRGRGRSREMMARGGTVNRMSVDHRPRALAILGVTKEEKEELMPHFVKFGEVEDLRDQDANSVVMTFKTRSEAENAANQGAKFKGRVLQISWYKPKMPSIATEPEEEEAKDEENKVKGHVQHLEEEDDDEDDEYESRSWRR
uniref:RNA binding motif protein 27 n=1 Tax=Scophthalmus maximus TaxID=52904 RepID=A0A8D3D9R0_SCOMX